MTGKNHLIPTLIALVAGIAGILIVLYAWHLPPFRPAYPQTENAYIRGKVTSLAPQLSGYISTVEVQDFDHVTAGQVIARIDDRQFRQRLNQAQASLQSAEAALGAAGAAHDTAQSTWDRDSALQERGVTAQRAADQTRLALRQAVASVAQSESAIAVARENVNGARVGLAAKRADIASAQAAVELARIDLDNTVIRAPSDGTLGQVGVHPGQYVTPGTALVSHVGAEIWVIANFRETELHGMRVGDPARFDVDALQHRSFSGRVQSFSPATASEFSILPATNATGNFTKVAQRLPVRISIDPDQDMAEFLEPGLSVVVTVDPGQGDGIAQTGAAVMGPRG